MLERGVRLKTVRARAVMRRNVRSEGIRVRKGYIGVRRRKGYAE